MTLEWIIVFLIGAALGYYAVAHFLVSGGNVH